MQWTVLLGFLALMCSTLDALPWSPTDPSLPPPLIHNIDRGNKQRHLAAQMELLHQSKVANKFMGPRQAGSVEKDEDDDDYDYEVDYADDYDAQSAEEAYDWR